MGGGVIDAKHQDPFAPKILHKVDRAGICLPANYPCCCDQAADRSYMWITESGYESNTSIALCGCLPMCVEDFISKTYFDKSPFKGIATEHDLNYCCWCCNCVCAYDLCTKPCAGGVVASVCVPNENECMFKIATRCCAPCCVSGQLMFVKDSQVAKGHLLSAMCNAEKRKKMGASTKAPEPQVMIQVP